MCYTMKWVAYWSIQLSNIFFHLFEGGSHIVQVGLEFFDQNTKFADVCHHAWLYTVLDKPRTSWMLGILY